MNIKRIGLIGGNYSPNSGNNTTGDSLWKVQNNLLIAQDSNRSITLGTSISIGINVPTEISENGMIVSNEKGNIIYIGSNVHICEETENHLTIGSGGIKLYNDVEKQETITIPEKVHIGYYVTIGNHVTIQDNFNTNRYIDSHNDLKPECIPIDSSLKNSSQLAVNIEPQSNGNIKIGDTLFMPATPSGDPMHYAYETAGAEYNATTDFIVKDAPWKDMVDTIEDKAKWGFDVVDASQVKQMTINGTTYNYVQTTRRSPGGTTEPRYFLVSQASNGTWVEDETKVLHLPDHWYLNGLGDITDLEMKKVWEAPHNAMYATGYAEAFIRTPLVAGNGSSVPINLDGWMSLSQIESVVVRRGIYPSSASPTIFNSKLLRYIIQSNDMYQHIYSYTGYNIPTTTFRAGMFYALKKPLSFTSFIISKPSILYAIINASPTTPITITLHTDRYAQLSEDADIVAALEAKNAALEGTGGSISLVSA